MEKLAPMLEDKWEDVGRKLNIQRKELETIKTDFHSNSQRAARMLDMWRSSDDAIEREQGVTRHLKSVMEQVSCNPKAIDFAKKFI